jgi:NADH dehydrogenase
MILVAGGTGFIGSAAVRRLVAAGSDVAVMTAHPSKRGGRIEAIGARAVAGDVTDAASLRRATRGADTVIQALTFPTFPVQKPRRGFTFEEFDHLGTERLARAAAQAGAARFVYVSGSGAAPDASKVWYRAKWGGEEAVRATGIDHVILRPSWLYGPEDRALNRFVAFARWAPFVPVIGHGRQRLQPVLVDDVAEAIVQAARPGGPVGTFEIGGPEVLTMNEVLRALLEALGKRKPLLHFPAWMPKAAGFVLQVLPTPPLSPGAVDFLTGDALADVEPLIAAFHLELTPFREGLASYLA